MTQTRERADRQAQQPDKAHFNTPENQALEFVQQNQGQPLDTSAREIIEPKFAHDFANIRVFADGQAPDLANKLDARAFTIGQNIVFGANEYQPHSRDGQGLLAHELAHTMQQRQVDLKSSKNLEIADRNSNIETEARAASTNVLAGQGVNVSSSSAAMIAREKKDEIPEGSSNVSHEEDGFEDESTSKSLEDTFRSPVVPQKPSVVPKPVTNPMPQKAEAVYGPFENAKRVQSINGPFETSKLEPPLGSSDVSFEDDGFEKSAKDDKSEDIEINALGVRRGSPAPINLLGGYYSVDNNENEYGDNGIRAGGGIFSMDSEYLALQTGWADLASGNFKTPDANGEMTGNRYGIRGDAKTIYGRIGSTNGSGRVEGYGPRAQGDFSSGEDGASFGLGGSIVGGDITLGSLNQDEIDYQGHVGVSAGLSLAGRGHWGDDDHDGYREIGIGADFGPFSLDLKTEYFHKRFGYPEAFFGDMDTESFDKEMMTDEWARAQHLPPYDNQVTHEDPAPPIPTKKKPQ